MKMMRSCGIYSACRRKLTGLLPVVLVLITVPSLFSAADDGWLYLDNGHLRLGVKTNSGACIGYLAESKTGRNLLNHYDQGRFIQQSWYGAKDGSDWNGKPWRWNPVQGGDWKGAPSKLLELRHTGTNLYSRTTPRHWASGMDITNAVMEQWITLEGRIARVKFKFTYTGATSHPTAHQEMPAVFVDAALTNLVYYRGDKPWTGAALTRRIPGWPNEHDRMDESWAAYVDDKDWGLGVFVPGVKEMTFYRFAGSVGSKGSGCSYVAPVKSMAITQGFTHSYEVYLSVGETAQLRSAFNGLQRADSGPKSSR